MSVAGQIHPKFFCLLWVLADKQTRNYYALIGAEEEIGSEAFTWSRARTFSFNKMMMIAFITINCGLVPLIEGLQGGSGT